MPELSPIRSALERCAEWKQAPGSKSPRLACKLAPALKKEQIAAAWPSRSLRSELFELWGSCQEAELFVDDRGQRGLKLLSPGESAARTRLEQGERPTDLDPADTVLGEFLGADELLVVGESGELFVALPLDYRSDWRRAGADLGEFLTSYVAAEGDKFWEETS
jgi:hypothetical protein